MNMRAKPAVIAGITLLSLIALPWTGIAKAQDSGASYVVPHAFPQYSGANQYPGVYPTPGFEQTTLPPVIEVVSGAGDCACQQCGCQEATCPTCNQCARSGCSNFMGKQRRQSKCPNCECENCVLVVANSEETRTCFKVEQKVVCIPKVRLPWQKNCPPTTSRSRVVTILKNHSYKCPGCSYTWTDKVPELNKETGNTLDPSDSSEAYDFPPVGGYSPSPTTSVLTMPTQAR